MEKIMVEATTKTYPICFAEDFAFLSQQMKEMGFAGRTMCIITDSQVAPLYLEQVKKELDLVAGSVFSYSFPAGEKQKNLQTIEEMMTFFLQNRFDRKTVLIALGGGVCGDMTGFAASIYMRGIPFVQIPTTLLSQVDSSVGGKTGIDFLGSKNIIGAFYQPDFVYINLNTLKSLPKREFSAGMAEVIKYGYILSRPFLQTLYDNQDAMKQIEVSVLKQVVKNCCQMKAWVVSKDEKENGLREILNFGHTIGHAVESLKEFSLLHGECVGIGMIAILTLGVKRGELAEEELDFAKKLLSAFDIPTTGRNLSAEEVYEQMFLDKKVKNHKISLIMLEEIGKAYATTEVTKDVLLDGISEIIE